MCQGADSNLQTQQFGLQAILFSHNPLKLLSDAMMRVSWHHKLWAAVVAADDMQNRIQSKFIMMQDIAVAVLRSAV